MITLQFFKKDALRYVSHIDLLRLMTRTLRRSGVEIKFSEGFNPHMLLNFATPLPVGFNSSSEYITIDTECDAKTFLKRYNDVCIAGLEGIRAFEVSKNPNLAAKVIAADYSIRHHDAYKCKMQIEDIINQREYVIDYPTKKNKESSRDIASKLYAIKVHQDTINFCVSAGNESLRADRFAEHLVNRFGVKLDMSSIWRYTQYVREVTLLNVEDYLANKG